MVVSPINHRTPLAHLKPFHTSLTQSQSTVDVKSWIFPVPLQFPHTSDFSPDCLTISKFAGGYVAISQTVYCELPFDITTQIVSKVLQSSVFHWIGHSATSNILPMNESTPFRAGLVIITLSPGFGLIVAISNIQTLKFV